MFLAEDLKVMNLQIYMYYHVFEVNFAQNISCLGQERNEVSYLKTRGSHYSNDAFS